MPLGLRAVSLRYGCRQILDRVDCSLERGRLVALLGPSGVGKSSVLALLDGRIEPTSGDRVVSDRGGRVSTTWVTQATVLIRGRNVIDNVALGALRRSSGHQQARALAAGALEAVGLGALAEVPAEVLSGGEQQRVAIARALAFGADVTFADEPTASLDEDGVLAVVDALRAVASAGGAVAVATHDARVACRADEVWTVQGCRIDARAVDSRWAPARGGR
ncbi:MAG: ATP-binding cassette domain-containing protein [Acidimicrobiia bacterium]